MAVSYRNSGELSFNLGCKDEDACSSDISVDTICSLCCEYDLCNTNLCPVFQVDETWSVWSVWSRCSKTCGYGQNVRHRQCTTIGRCEGNQTDMRECKLIDCNVEGNTWSGWSLWSQCSRSCGMGLRTRTRFCSSNQCLESSAQTDFCNNHPCAAISTIPSSIPTTKLQTTTPSILSTSTPSLESTMAKPFSINISNTNYTTIDQQPPLTTSLTLMNISSSIGLASLTTIKFPFVYTSELGSITTKISSTPFSSVSSSPRDQLTTHKLQLLCRQNVPTIDHGYLTNLTEDVAMFKCYNGFEFTYGGQTASILCDKSTQTWNKPYPACKTKGDCSKDRDCNNGYCILASRRCRCTLGYFNTNCDTEIKIGLLVVRGPDWTWGDQDGRGLGNITRIAGFTPGWIWVQWKNVDFGNEYRVGAEGKYEIRPYER